MICGCYPYSDPLKQSKFGSPTLSPDGLAITPALNKLNPLENISIVILPEFGGTETVIGGFGEGSAPDESKLIVMLFDPSGTPPYCKSTALPLQDHVAPKLEGLGVAGGGGAH